MTTIGDMEAMLAATLSFARDDAASEAPKRVDVSALVAVSSTIWQMPGCRRGRQSGGVAIDCKPLGLRRAITNLAQNAVKYGGARAVSRTTGYVQILVDDEGSGIPEAEMGRVLEPFYRLEASRNPDTGGVASGSRLPTRWRGRTVVLATGEFAGRGLGRRSSCRGSRIGASAPITPLACRCCPLVVQRAGGIDCHQRHAIADREG